MLVVVVALVAQIVSAVQLVRSSSRVAISDMSYQFHRVSAKPSARDAQSTLAQRSIEKLLVVVAVGVVFLWLLLSLSSLSLSLSLKIMGYLTLGVLMIKPLHIKVPPTLVTRGDRRGGHRAQGLGHGRGFGALGYSQAIIGMSLHT